MERIVSQFSCGAASAVATKLLLGDYPAERVLIVNAFLVEEHEDNQRFMSQCEEWFGHPIVRLRDEKFGASAVEVWKQAKFLVSHGGTRCSKTLKRDVLKAIALPDDIMALGYTSEEYERYNRFVDANNGQRVIAPLIDRGLRKADCLAMLQRAGIELPMMYRLGFNNNNCIGCPKGGEGYWNRTRKVFPAQFQNMVTIQEILGPGSYFFRNHKTGERYGVKDIPEGAGRHDEPEIECSMFCLMAEREINQGS
jgi:hypothetical protein